MYKDVLEDLLIKNIIIKIPKNKSVLGVTYDLWVIYIKKKFKKIKSLERVPQTNFWL